MTLFLAASMGLFIVMFEATSNVASFMVVNDGKSERSYSATLSMLTYVLVGSTLATAMLVLLTSVLGAMDMFVLTSWSMSHSNAMVMVVATSVMLAFKMPTFVFHY